MRNTFALLFLSLAACTAPTVLKDAPVSSTGPTSTSTGDEARTSTGASSGPDTGSSGDEIDPTDAGSTG